ncbi:Sodium Bile acid symporter family protein, partial [Aphelenchoides avenae]
MMLPESINDTAQFRPEDLQRVGNDSWRAKTQVTVSGLQLGKTAMQVRLSVADDTDAASRQYVQLFRENDKTVHVVRPSEDRVDNFDLWVIRNPDKQYFTKIFVALLIILITIANVLMGCELDLNVVWETVRPPVAPAIGFFTQFFLMPLLAYAIAQTILVDRGMYSFALGLFVTGCSPAGGASNFWTILLDGNAHLSVTMTFISMVASLCMMPFWMNLLGYKFLRGFSSGQMAVVRVPYLRIVSGLVALVVPLLIGVLIAKYRPSCAAHARKMLRPFVVFLLVFLIVFGTISNLYMFSIMTWPALLAGLLLPWCGFMFGCFASIIMGQKPQDVTAIAIETGVQNTGIAIMLLKFSFPEPDADISSLLPVIVACFTPGPLLLGFAVHSFMKFIRKRRTASLDDEPGVEYKSEQGPATLQNAVSTGSPKKLAKRPLIKPDPSATTSKPPPSSEWAQLSEEEMAQILDD